MFIVSSSLFILFRKKPGQSTFLLHNWYLNSSSTCRNQLRPQHPVICLRSTTCQTIGIMRSMRVKIRHFNKYLLNPLGLHVTPFLKSNTLGGFISLLKSKDITFNRIYDVGAYKGHWTQSVRRILPDANFYMFEPNTEHNSELQKQGHSFFNLLLGQHEGKEVDFFSVGNTGDSYYREVNPVYGSSNIKKLKMRTLDSAILEFGLPQPDFLKIDTQGSELDILKGGTIAVKNSKLIIAELPISALNPGSPGIQEFLEFMNHHHFTPVRITEIHDLLGVLVQIDVAFLSAKTFETLTGHKNPYQQ